MKENTKACILMLLCTVFLSTGQYFSKLASQKFALTIEGIILNSAYIASLVFAGMGAVLLTKALGKGDLSRIYPLISLSFVWTLAIAYFLFQETINGSLIIGLTIIIIGVILLASEGDTR